MRLACCALLFASAAGQVCDIEGDASALRRRAAEHFALEDTAAADACLSAAFAQLTSDLEALAAEAEAVRAFRAARRGAPAAVPTNGCVVDAAGASLCLPPVADPAPAGAAGAAVAVAAAAPATAAACGSEASALALLQRRNPPMAPAALDAFVVEASQRRWWTAATRAVDELRQQNTPPGQEARRAVTEIRDAAGGLLVLMRQTKMDEATISCAVMWAQGASTVHLSVKFAGRLDAPVTVLNVDHEVVVINGTHVTFSGLGRQKPKRYVLELELYAAIDANASSWSFGSVGTVNFKLAKGGLAPGRWPRLISGTEPVKNHRVWWEKEEQVEREDEKIATEKAAAVRKERADEAATAKAATDKLKAAEVAAAAELARAAALELRARHLPALEGAAAAVDGLAEAGAAEAQTDALREARREALAAAHAAAQAAAATLLDVVGMRANETAVAEATSKLASVHRLVSSGFGELTKDALATAVAGFKAWCEALVEPEPAAPAKRKTKKKKAKKAKA